MSYRAMGRMGAVRPIAKCQSHCSKMVWSLLVVTNPQALIIMSCIRHCPSFSMASILSSAVAARESCYPHTKHIVQQCSAGTIQAQALKVQSACPIVYIIPQSPGPLVKLARRS